MILLSLTFFLNKFGSSEFIFILLHDFFFIIIHAHES